MFPYFWPRILSMHAPSEYAALNAGTITDTRGVLAMVLGQVVARSREGREPTREAWRSLLD